MVERIKAMRKEGDSVGGLVECRVRNLPVGLGVPVFDRLEADMAKAMLSRYLLQRDLKSAAVLTAPYSKAPSTTMYLSIKTARSAPRLTVRAGCKAGSATAKS